MNKRILPIIALLSITALSATALPPAEREELTLTELSAKKLALDGKIIQTEITGARSFTQVAEGKYSVYCVYYSGGSVLNSGGESIFFDEGGKEFFQELSKKDYWGSSEQKIYVYVLVEKKKLTAVGTSFKRSKKAYSW